VAFPRLINPGYIRTMKIPVRAGREFTEHDGADSQKVLIVNETMARRLWPDRDRSVRSRSTAGGMASRWSVGDVRHGALEQVAVRRCTFQSRKTEIGFFRPGRKVEAPNPITCLEC